MRRIIFRLSLVVICLIAVEGGLVKREVSVDDEILNAYQERNVQKKTASLADDFKGIIGDSPWLKGIIDMLENVGKLVLDKSNIARVTKNVKMSDTKTSIQDVPIKIDGQKNENLLANYRAIFNKHKQVKESSKQELPKMMMSIDETPNQKDKDESDLSYLVSSEHWFKLLFGPTGAFTSVMKQFADARKQEKARGVRTEKGASSDSIGSSKDSLTKVMTALFTAPKDKQFNEPLPELPLLGVCNRINCGQIYTAIDSFRKSEMFSNMQTAVSLMQDEKGLDMLTELMSNPHLIAQFTGAGGLGKMFGLGEETKVKPIKKEDNLGVDLSELPEEKPFSKPDLKALPEIAENIDYYSSVDKVPGDKEDEIDGPSVVTKEETIVKPKIEGKKAVDFDYYGEVKENGDKEIEVMTTVGQTTTLSTTTSIATKTGFNTKEVPYFVEPELPEISGNVDEYGETFEKLEKVEITSGKTSQIIHKSDSSGKHEIVSTTTSKPRKHYTPKRITEPVTTTKQPTPSTTIATTQKPLIPKTTRKNFRRDSDYYSMYYDDTTN
uniref:SERPIN domain-containing protein n=1 Tax=Rhabditophanes sp. KR3021 TaxID=114890 RepID=A0AC35TVJ9_9BILA